MNDLPLKVGQDVETPGGPAQAYEWVVTVSGDRLLRVTHNLGENPKTHRSIIIWKEYPPEQVSLTRTREGEPPPLSESVSQQTLRTPLQDAKTRTQRRSR